MKRWFLKVTKPIWRWIMEGVIKAAFMAAINDPTVMAAVAKELGKQLAAALPDVAEDQVGILLQQAGQQLIDAN